MAKRNIKTIPGNLRITVEVESFSDRKELYRRTWVPISPRDRVSDKDLILDDVNFLGRLDTLEEAGRGYRVHLGDIRDPNAHIAFKFSYDFIEMNSPYFEEAAILPLKEEDRKQIARDYFKSLPIHIIEDLMILGDQILEEG